jgi:Fic family protein
LRVRAGSIEEKVQRLAELQAQATPEQRADYDYRVDVSWIHYDSANEGVVYEPNELMAALDQPGAQDGLVLPVHDEIRQFKAAIDLTRQLATNKKLEIDLDIIKQIYTTLAPEEAEGKGPPKYRKDIPLHRVYFHEIAAPDKIAYKMRKLVHWLQSDETKRTTHATRIASRAHYRLLHIFPFPKHSGKVARLLLNLLLMRDGYPPAILHATDRQRYYDALRTSSDAVSGVINESLENAVDSALRYFHRVLDVEEVP